MRSERDSPRRPIRVIPAPAIHTSRIGPQLARPGRGPSTRIWGAGPSRGVAPRPRGGRRGPCDELHELPPARGRRRRGDAELPNEPEEIGALEDQDTGGVGAVADHVWETPVVHVTH